MSKSTPATQAQRESTWQDRLARYVASGRSVVAFCRDESISVASFYGWRHRLSARDGAPAAASPAEPYSPFIDLGPLTAARPAKPASPTTSATVIAGIELRIDLGQGIVITVVRH
jgi:hypothetical protein